MSTYDPRLPDDEFTDVRAAFVADLRTVLDIVTGVEDATHPDRYAALTTDLNAALDLDAGLGLIIGIRSDISSAARPRTDSSRHDVDLPSPSRITNQLTSLTDVERLGIRVHPSYHALRQILDLSRDLDLIHNLDLDLDAAQTGDVARNLTGALTRDLDIDLDRTLDLGRSHTVGLVRDFALALARTRARALALALVRARALARARARTRSLARALARARDLARDLALALALDVDLAAGVDLDLNLEEPTPITALYNLVDVVDDFAGADLREVTDFRPSDWEGVRWSTDTLWPPGWVERVRAMSHEIDPGIFEVTQDGRHNMQTAGT